jgi:hypothetical protein
MSCTLRSSAEIATVSKASSANGRLSASPAMNGRPGSSERVASPAPDSRAHHADGEAGGDRTSTQPGEGVSGGACARPEVEDDLARPASTATALRHSRVCPSDMRSFTRSYRRAVRSNIAATSCGCLSNCARVMASAPPYLLSHCDVDQQSDADTDEQQDQPRGAADGQRFSWLQVLGGRLAVPHAGWGSVSLSRGIRPARAISSPVDDPGEEREGTSTTPLTRRQAATPQPTPAGAATPRPARCPAGSAGY